MAKKKAAKKQKRPEPSDTFDEIAEATIKEIEEVECALPVFYNGLRHVITKLQERYQMGKEMGEIE